jgi:hypothetical protein
MPNHIQPWYRQFWPWFLIALPATAVVASLYTLYLAASDAPALVVDDYARIGLANKRNFQLDQRARDLALQANLSIGEGATPALSLRLSGKLTPMPESLVLKLAHPTLAELDQRIMLLPAGDAYEGVLPERRSRYYVQLEPADAKWRLSGVMYPDTETITLGPRDQQ